MDKVNEETLLAAGFRPVDIFHFQQISKDNNMDINCALPLLSRQFKYIYRALSIVVLIPILIADKSDLNIALGFTLITLLFVPAVFPARLGYRAWLLNKVKRQSTASEEKDV